MKKLVLVLGVCLMFAAYSVASAEEAAKTGKNNLRKNAGCGWGTNIWEGSDSLSAQACAIGSNHALCGNQEFGVLSGTAGCEKWDGMFGSNDPARIFVADNMDNLAKDIAKGNGEYLTTLAILLHISSEEKTNFYSKLQSNFNNIYTSADVTSDQVIKNIEKAAI